MKLKIFPILICFTHLFSLRSFSQNFKEVKIGDQVWMAENLNVDHFRNGDSIPEVKSADEWWKAGENHQPAWCYYDNNPSNGDKYGKLYNWYAVNDPRGLAPEGYHVPTDKEWTTLTNYLGGEDVAGKKMKSMNEWKENGDGGANDIGFSIGTNESGFTALPGGFREANGDYYRIGCLGYWWSSTNPKTKYSLIRKLSYSIDNVMYFSLYVDMGVSVRLVRDKS